MNTSRRFAILAIIAISELSCAMPVMPRQTTYDYVAKLDAKVNRVSFSPAKNELLVEHRALPTYFCSVKDEHFCVRSSELFLQIPRSFVPKSGAAWQVNDVSHVYTGASRMDFRGRSVYVHQIQTRRPTFGTVDFFISPVYGLVRFSVVMPEGTARYELAQDLFEGLKVFEGDGSERWKEPRK